MLSLLTKKVNNKARNKKFARTKIVATLGPSSESIKTLEKMIIAGLDVARLNFSHGSHDWHKNMFDKVRSLSDEVAILFDLQGPLFHCDRCPCEMSNCKCSIFL